MTDDRTTMLARPEVRVNGILKNVYIWMTGGLALTGLVAWLVSRSPAALNFFFGNPVAMMLLIIAPFILIFTVSGKLERISAGTAVGCFIGYAAVMGVTLSVVFLAYTQLVIFQTFFIAAGMFAGISIYALITKRDLNSIGSYLIMGLWGIIIASGVNMLIGSATIYYIISIVGVLLFLGLTAWDTQKIKKISDAYGTEMNEDDYIKISIIGALSLYLDFLNIFLYLLRIFGSRKN